MKSLILFSLFLCLASGFEFPFDTDLEGWDVKNDIWYWANRQMIPNAIPPGPQDGFAVMDGDDLSDEMFWPLISVPNGGTANISFFTRSATVDSNEFQLQKSYDNVGNAITIVDLKEYITTTANQFITVTVDLGPDPTDYYIGFYCYNSEHAVVGNWFQGCLIDYITVLPFDAPDTTPTSEPTTPEPTTPEPTTPEPTTPEPTTPEPTTPEPTTPEPTTPEPTTPEPTTPEPTTPEPTTPEPTTPEPTTPEPTTPEPTTPEPTTPEPTTPELTTPDPTTPKPTTPEATTPEPTTPEPTTPEPTTKLSTIKLTTREQTSSTSSSGEHNYNFQNGMDGWSLSHMNGAYWIRSFADNDTIVPGISPAGPWIIEVRAAEQYSATTLAQSPYFVATSTDFAIDITFWMEGTDEFPCQLKVRKRNNIDKFDSEPILNLDNFGDKINPGWVTYIDSSEMTVGEQFVIILEGSLAGGNRNKLYISEIMISGVDEIPLQESANYNFEDGLAGWSSGNMDGGRWDVMDWQNDGGNAMGIPRPINGSMILVVNKFETHSGVITIETPPIKVTQGGSKEVTFKFWTKGNANYPVALRLRVKTNGGLYAPQPFVNLIDSGTVNHFAWVKYTGDFTIAELPVDTEYLQLVLEADMGSDPENLLALDDLEITDI